MGIDTASIKFLCAAKSMGVDFETTAMIGRQYLFPDPGVLHRVFQVLEIPIDGQTFIDEHLYSEELFKLLGARSVESFDASDYEGATHLHDMNSPIPEQFRERYSVVHEGGTLEHVFNIPQAFRNCMEMVRVGGHFLQVNAANSLMGHGFWQMSPELLYRVFSIENGYRTEAMLLHEITPGGRWYVVVDPDHVRRRVELSNKNPTYILTIARRIAIADIFSKWPQQSDYSAIWHRHTEVADGEAPHGTTKKSRDVPRSGFIAEVRRMIPRPVKRWLRSTAERFRNPFRSPFDPQCYVPIPEADLLRGRLGLYQAQMPDSMKSRC
jgi:hypothetical protein